MEYPFGVAAFVSLAFPVGSDPKPEQYSLVIQQRFMLNKQRVLVY